jgi:hypothetical protein
MSLLLKSGEQYFEISDGDLATSEISQEQFEAAGAAESVADRSLVSELATPVFTAWDPAWQVPIGSGCTDKPTYGASCGKAPNCP